MPSLSSGESGVGFTSCCVSRRSSAQRPLTTERCAAHRAHVAGPSSRAIPSSSPAGATAWPNDAVAKHVMATVNSGKQVLGLMEPPFAARD
jgi:hypothetical protein